MKLLFWISLIGVTYSYFIYPMLLLLLPKRKSKGLSDEKYLPKVTLIITAFNEEHRIEEKLKNTLELTFPASNLEIIVASDASDDNTDNIIKSYENEGIKLIRAEDRKGKENAQRLAIQASTGEILVFSDVATKLQPDGIQVIVSNFSNSDIGAVSSADRFVTHDGKLVGEGAYVKYEMWLRDLESSVNSLVGLSGSFFAARRTVCDEWDISIPSDFNTALNSVRKNYVSISDNNSIGYYTNIKDDSKEYQRKFRTAIRGMSAVAKKFEVLNVFKYGLFSFQIWSHKIMRWLVPWFMLGLIVASFYLYAENFIYSSVVGLQLFFYSLVIVGFSLKPSRNYFVFKIPYFFMQVNIAIAHASIAFLGGKRVTMWKPSKR